MTPTDRDITRGLVLLVGVGVGGGVLCGIGAALIVVCLIELVRNLVAG